MNAFKMNKNTKTGKSGETVHQASDGPSPMKWMSPTAEGPLSAFYSADPVLSLGNLIQPKLTIGQPNDRYEQEADRVADQVMRMPEPKQSLVNGHLSLGKREKESSLVQRQSTYPGCPEKEGIQTKPIDDQITPLVQLQEEEPEEEEEEEPVQTKPISDQITPLVQRQEEELEEEEEETPIQAKFQSFQVPLLQRQEEEEEEEEEIPIQAKQLSNKSLSLTHGLQNQIQTIRGGGQPLAQTTRSFFEPRFGRDFSNVRVHTDAIAADAAKAINAKAFTTGKDMVFGLGYYSPFTSTGKSLLAHELTHVVQQQGGISRIQKWDLGAAPPPDPDWELVEDQDPEHERRLAQAEAIVSDLVDNSERCNQYFEDECGDPNALRDTFNNTRIYFLDEGGLSFGARIGNNIAYTRTSFRWGRFKIASTLLHEMFHSCDPTMDALREFRAESALEQCRLYTPIIAWMDPRRASVGDVVDIIGLNFGTSQGPADLVTFNGVDAGRAQSWQHGYGGSGVQIRIRVPAGAASGPVVVTNNRVRSNEYQFTVI